MSNFAYKENFPNYAGWDAQGVPSVGPTYFRAAGGARVVAQQDAVSTRKLNHALSNLPEASRNRPPMTQEEVIRRAQAGEFGSTEVPLIQIW